METKTIGQILLGVISVTLALFMLSLGISHYVQQSINKVDSKMIVYRK